MDSAAVTGRVGARLDVLGGRLDVDAVPGWGTTVTAMVSPTAPRAAAAHPLADLGSVSWRSSPTSPGATATG